MSFFVLDENKCRRDGVCMDVCPTKIIKQEVGELPYIAEKSEAFCIACGLCYAFCPHDACYVESLNKDEFIQIDKNLKISNDSAVQFLKSRRSVRKFKNRSLDQEDLATILDTARYAPSAKNMQPVRWIAVRGFDKMKELAELMYTYYDSLARNKDFSKDERLHAKLISSAYKSGNDVFFRGAPDLIVAVLPKDYKWAQDGAIALTYIELAASGIGAGCCWAGYFTTAVNNDESIKKFVGLADSEIVIGGQMIGYPVFRAKNIPSRKKLDINYIE